MILLSSNSFDISHRPLYFGSGRLLWRVSLTTDSPLAINYPGLLGLAAQLELTPADIVAVLGTEAFPPQLNQLDQPPRPLRSAQWSYKHAVAALLALQAAKG